MILPQAALTNHIAVLGKTGAGKSSTVKLIVEDVVPAGARVCILDPVKSDYWGLISSADGRRPGLPFRILGGPHGHIPLHASAGAAIGELVGNGKLPLSIIDMADFKAGDLQRFFVDFAPALLRAMRGILYLVIDEAHEMAPKERAGFGQENQALHYAKKLATAGRSKGIRLIVATQRTQALHNAVLGSCETMVALRFTTPADQKPVVDWFKANANKKEADTVAASLSGLPTGTGWVCSGEARLFEKRHFPHITTYDNSATPTSDSIKREVASAPVDADELRAILGQAVREAEANDPRRLKARIAELERQVASSAPAAADPTALAEADRRGEARGYSQGTANGFVEGYSKASADWQARITALLSDAPPPAPPATAPRPSAPLVAAKPPMRPVPPREPARRVEAGDGPSKVEAKFLTALVQRAPRSLTRNQVAIFAGYSVTSRHVDNVLGGLRSKGWIEGGGSAIKMTVAGMEALGPYDPLPTGAALRQFWLGECGAAERAFLAVLIEIYPETINRDSLAERAGYSPTSRHVDNTLARLRSLDLAVGGRAAIRASDDLFTE